MEASLGAPLFLRGRQRLHLLPSGEVLLAYAGRLIELADAARHAVADGRPRGTLKLGALESTAASRLPAVFCAFHERFPEVRIELTTGTNDALETAVSERRLDAAFIASPPSRSGLSHSSAFRERLVLITSLTHSPVLKAADVAGESVIAFPRGCAYRRVLERWLGDKDLSSVGVLELSSYHAIVACVASGSGVAIVPESVLATVRRAAVAVHVIPKVLANFVTPLVWRFAEQTTALVALREVIPRIRGAQRPTLAA